MGSKFALDANSVNPPGGLGTRPLPPTPPPNLHPQRGEGWGRGRPRPLWAGSQELPRHLAGL